MHSNCAVRGKGRLTCALCVVPTGSGGPGEHTKHSDGRGSYAACESSWKVI